MRSYQLSGCTDYFFYLEQKQPPVTWFMALKIYLLDKISHIKA